VDTGGLDLRRFRDQHTVEAILDEAVHGAQLAFLFMGCCECKLARHSADCNRAINVTAVLGPF
jgi:hypothetical protein